MIESVKTPQDAGVPQDAGLTPYAPPLFLGNGHLQSILPSVFRRVAPPAYERETLELADGDFLEVDWLRRGQDRVAILSHGLGGHSRRAYISGMARALSAAGWDIAAWNFRGCGGALNRRPAFTHSGSSGDLAAVIDSARSPGRYRKIALVGFSMGANITLLYLGRKGNAVPDEVCGAVAFSAPSDLRAAAEAIGRPGNRIYMTRFLRQLREQLQAMSARFPDQISLRDYETVHDFKDFDDRYTAPLHGFKDALDYWEQSSSRRVLRDIVRPAWIISARNDPFLAPACFPEAEAAENPCVHLVAPASGGHCGFMRFNKEKCYWSEYATVTLLQKI